MRKFPIFVAIASLFVFNVSAFAQVPTLLYSYENGDSPNNLDGFVANGSTIPITQGTIGATNGSNSMDFSQKTTDTFTGASTTSFPAALISPWTEEINFDLTVPVNGQFTGTFADIGISEFGSDNSSPPDTYIDQLQTTPNANKNIDLAPGTYNLSIPLQALYNPITGDGPVSFSSCFGSDPNSELTALTGFEFYINKSNDDPLTVYIDNVKGEPLLGDTNDDFKVDSTDLNTVMANYGKAVTGGFASGDFNGDGIVNADDFALYQYGVVEYNFLTFRPLPEPACLGLLGGGLLALATRRRHKLDQ